MALNLLYVLLAVAGGILAIGLACLALAVAWAFWFGRKQ